MSDDKVKKLVEYLKVNDLYDEAVELTEYHVIPFEDKEYIGALDGYPMIERYAKTYTTFMGKRVSEENIRRFHGDSLEKIVESVKDSFEDELAVNPKLSFLVSTHFKYDLRSQVKVTLKDSLKALRSILQEEAKRYSEKNSSTYTNSSYERKRKF